MSGQTPRQGDSSSELGRAARGSIVTLLGAASSSALGFVLSVLLARALGAGGAGVVLQAVSAFTIALSISRLGLDTTAVWLLPRLRGEDPSRIRAALVALLVPALAAPVLVAGAWYLFTWTTSEPVGLDPEVYDAVGAVAVFLPMASVMTVALAATRAFGGVFPFNLIGNITVPGLRPLLVGAIALWGGGTTAVALGWAVPWLVGALLSLLVLHRQLRRNIREHGPWRPDRELRGRVRRFALPRVAASALEQSITYLDVVLVGILIGSTAAGVYGTVARFVNAGNIVATALRIVVAPRFSAMLGEDRKDDVEELYTVTARWILLVGSPAYLLLAVFAPTVLDWLGSGFDDGTTAMRLLCLGSVVVLAAGNVQSLLLMSGRSAASAVNKLVVLVANVVGNLVLVPRIGIEGAAITWAACMVLDTVLASWQVRRGVGVSLALGAVGYVALVVALTVGLPSVAVAAFLGQGTPQLLLALVLSGVLLLGYVAVDRKRLRVDELRRIRAGA